MSDWSEEVGGRRSSAWVLPLQIACGNCGAAVDEYCTLETAAGKARRHIPCNIRTRLAS